MKRSAASDAGFPPASTIRLSWLRSPLAQAFHCGPYCCFGAAGGLSAGAVVSPGVDFFFLVLVFDFVFFFGVLGSAAGVWSL
jgi:hypothetical protein